MSVLENIVEIGVDFLLKEPFYAHLLSGLNREVTMIKTTSLALADQQDFFLLYIHPDYWRSISSTQRYGALKHEILHLVFQHPLRANTYRNSFLFSVAADLQVNQYLSAEQRLPGAIHTGLFPDLVVQEEMSFEDFFQQLEQAQQDPRSATHQQLQHVARLSEKPLSSHQYWFTQRSLLENSLLESILGNTIRWGFRQLEPQGVKALPDGIQRAISATEIVLVNSVNWKRILRLFVETSQYTCIKHTISRLSKRYGTSPGLKVRKRFRLLVAVDTSGSISLENLHAFFREIHHLWKRGISITVLEADAVLQDVWDYQGKIPAMASGDGGTNFDPVLEYANQQEGFGGLIYLTDGQGPRPTVASRLPLLWVIKGKREMEENHHLPGRKVGLKE